MHNYIVILWLHNLQVELWPYRAIHISSPSIYHFSSPSYANILKRERNFTQGSQLNRKNLKQISLFITLKQYTRSMVLQVRYISKDGVFETVCCFCKYENTNRSPRVIKVNIFFFKIVKNDVEINCLLTFSSFFQQSLPSILKIQSCKLHPNKQFIKCVN